jgi:hypothetical protein
VKYEYDECDMCKRPATVLVVAHPETDFKYREEGTYDWILVCTEHVVQAKDQIKGQSDGAEWIYAATIEKVWRHEPDTELELDHKQPGERKTAAARRSSTSTTSTAKVGSGKKIDMRTKEGRALRAQQQAEAATK